MKLIASALLVTLSAWKVDARVRGRGRVTENRTVRPRKLAQLMGYGGEPDPSLFPLKLCEGDCDTDDDCQGSLACYQRDKFENAPGCPGGPTFAADTDFCGPPRNAPPGTQPPVPASVLPAVEVEPEGFIVLVFIMNSGALPLGMCQGDCETDEDCLDELICFQRDMFERVPGCAGWGEASIDYCTKPFAMGEPVMITEALPPPGWTTPQGWTPPSLEIIGDGLFGMPLGLCEGDCDSDDDCLDNLICFQRDLLDPVPGCDGIGFVSYDYCILGPELPEAVPATPEPVPVPAGPEPVAFLTFAGDFYFFQLGKPLGLCQGDCDSDLDCLDNLVCFQPETSNAAVPFCAGAAQLGVDYCTLPVGGGANLPAITQAPASIGLSYTAPPGYEGIQLPILEEKGDDLAMPLGICQGDCDTDEDCLDELICFQRDLLDPVPGCIGEGVISYDYCVVEPNSVTWEHYIAYFIQPTRPPATSTTMTISISIFVVIADNPEMPLGLCEGDCDTDEDCLDELICFQRSYNEQVLGCTGQASTSYDYCVKDPLATGTPTLAPAVILPTMPPSVPTTPLPPLKEFQAPLGLCEGDCDYDWECAGCMVCYELESTFDSKPPGCTGEPHIHAGLTDPSGANNPVFDYCTEPTDNVGCYNPENDPMEGYLALCEGDCDKDSDCIDDLICFQRDVLEPVPGCSGRGRTSYDYCIVDPNPVAPPPTPLSIPATAQPVTAQPITAPPVSAPPVTMQPVQVVVVIEAPGPVPAPTDPFVIEAALEQPLTYVEPSTGKSKKGSKDKNGFGAGGILAAQGDPALPSCHGPCGNERSCAASLVCFQPGGVNGQSMGIPGCVGDPDGDPYCTTTEAMNGNNRHKRRLKKIRGRKR